jgi:hypothetical protein
MAVLTVALLSACAHKGPILVNFSYQRPQGLTVEQAPKAVVGISPFKDERGKNDSIVGKRFDAMNDSVNDLVVQGTVSEKLRMALDKALSARDIAWRDAPPWDLTEAGVPSDGSTLVISGEIKTLWVESNSTFANTKVTAKVDLRIVAADPAQKKIIRVLNVNSMIERSRVNYTTAFVQETISEALTTAINQLFNDEELKNRLK